MQEIVGFKKVGINTLQTQQMKFRADQNARNLQVLAFVWQSFEGENIKAE